MSEKTSIQELIGKDVNDLLTFRNIPAIDVKDIISFKGDGGSLIKQVIQAVKQDVDTQSKCDALNLGLSKVNKIKNVLEGVRKERKKPILDAGKNLDKQYKSITDPLTEIVQEGNKKVREWDQKVLLACQQEQREIDEANRKAEEARLAEIARREKISKAQGGDGSKCKEVPEPEKQEITTAPTAMTQSTQYAVRWVAEITDPAAVPASILHSDRVKEAMRMEAQQMVAQRKRDLGEKPELKNLTPIPGVKVVEVKDIRR